MGENDGQMDEGYKEKKVKNERLKKYTVGEGRINR